VNREIFKCQGCGSTTIDPARQLASLRQDGRLSCCPERSMQKIATLPDKIADQLMFTQAPAAYLEKYGREHPKCWQWAGRQNRNGYGRLRWEGKEPVAHRLIYVLITAVEVPREILLDHLCRNRLCCNPHHLDPVDSRTNTHRGEAVLFKVKDEYVPAPVV
jgi:hypothetical protein